MIIHCTGCNRDLPATTEYFHKKKSKTGFATRCKYCIKDYYKRYYNENHERVLEKKTEQSKVYYDKHRDEVIARRNQTHRMLNHKEWNRKYYELNKDTIKAKTLAYSQTEAGKAKKSIYQHNRRAKASETPSDFTLKQWKECKIHFNNTCAYCGKEKTLTKDHFLALKYGGEYTKNNIIPACKPCNSKKRADDFFEWYPKQSFYSKQREQKILNYLHYNNGTQQLALL